MRRLALLALLLVGFSVHAQTLTLERGDVIAQLGGLSSVIDTRPGPPDDLLIADSSGIPKPGVAFSGLPMYFGRGLFFIDQNRALFSGFRDGDYGVFEWRAGTINQLLDVSGGEILRTRNGELLTAAYPIDIRRPAIVRFTLAGDVRGIDGIPNAPQSVYFPGQTAYADVARMELLADQCTLLWTASTGLEVRTFDICTGKAKADFLDPASRFESGIQRLGSIRALPNGDVLIATDKDVRRFDRSGRKVAAYQAPEPAWPFSGETLLALTPDASGVWIGRYNLVHRIDFALPSSPAATFLTKDRTAVFALSVVGEWRAAEQPPPVPRRRSAR